MSCPLVSAKPENWVYIVLLASVFIPEGLSGCIILGSTYSQAGEYSIWNWLLIQVISIILLHWIYDWYDFTQHIQLDYYAMHERTLSMSEKCFKVTAYMFRVIHIVVTMIDCWNEEEESSTNESLRLLQLTRYSFTIIDIIVFFVIIYTGPTNQNLLRWLYYNNNNTSHPLPSSSSVAQLQQHLYNETYCALPDITCSICLDPLLLNKHVAQLKLCLHLFHTHCIKQWIKQKGCETRCPNCRSVLV